MTFARKRLQPLLSFYLFSFAFSLWFVWSRQCDSSSTFRQTQTSSRPMFANTVCFWWVVDIREDCGAWLLDGSEGVRGRLKKEERKKKTTMDESFRRLNDMLFVLLVLRYLLSLFHVSLSVSWVIEIRAQRSSKGYDMSPVLMPHISPGKQAVWLE